MAKRTFASRTFKARSFRSRTWAGDVVSTSTDDHGTGEKDDEPVPYRAPKKKRRRLTLLDEDFELLAKVK